MSDEEWNQRLQKSEERRRQKDAQIQKEVEQERATAKEAAVKIITPYLAMVNGQRTGDKTPAEEWKAAHAKVGRILASVLVAFHFQMDKILGHDVQVPSIRKFYEAEMPLKVTCRKIRQSDPTLNIDK
ncbi:hypothetical protein FPOAC2_04345 [Fusarium poae]